MCEENIRGKTQQKAGKQCSWMPQFADVREKPFNLAKVQPQFLGQIFGGSFLLLWAKRTGSTHLTPVVARDPACQSAQRSSHRSEISPYAHCSRSSSFWPLIGSVGYIQNCEEKKENVWLVTDEKFD